MLGWRKRRKPQDCVSHILNSYIESEKRMSSEDYFQLKKCLQEWQDDSDPEFLGAMAYVLYREGKRERMWEYIDKDLELNLGEEEHGAFIPAMMSDVDPETKYEILKKIHRKIGGSLSLELMTHLISMVGEKAEILSLAKEYALKNPRDHRAKRIIEELSHEGIN